VQYLEQSKGEQTNSLPRLLVCSFKTRELMKKIKKIFRKKKETATLLPKLEKAMLPKLEMRNK
jgi:hypothetical protein